MRIILASGSARRREILNNIGVSFTVETAGFDENEFLLLNDCMEMLSAQKTMILAREKAMRIMQRYSQNDDIAIIAADTVVEVDGRVLGKPCDNEEAKKMLALLQGREHKVITGVCVLKGTDGIILDSEETVVNMVKMTPEEIDDYVRKEYLLDKAGAYAIQGRASMFISGIEGCYFNVVGLPVYRLLSMCRSMKINIL